MSDEPRQLWSAADIARRYKITPAAVHHWQRRGGFPAPAALNGSGQPLYEPEAVRAWRLDWTEGRAKERERVRHLYRRRAGEVGALASVAKDAGVSARTARRWLMATGDIPQPKGRG